MRDSAEYFENLFEIIDDPIYIGLSEDDLQSEIKNNTWRISASQEEVESLKKADFILFFQKVIANRLAQIRNSSSTHGMIFYMWFDEQASQIRFSLISDFHKALPIRNPNLRFLETPETIYDQFLDSSYHDGISFTEFVVKDFTDAEPDDLDPLPAPHELSVYQVHLR